MCKRVRLCKSECVGVSVCVRESACKRESVREIHPNSKLISSVAAVKEGYSRYSIALSLSLTLSSTKSKVA